MYDYAHGQCDSIERITHSICTLEFDVHRPLYDWFIENLEIFPSRQYEFARLNLTYTVMSKRKLLELVNNNFVDGWDDPRMPTICGLRRRGYTPESIRLFAEKVGVAKRDNVIDLSLLEWCLRDDLNRRSNRYMAVINPVKLVIDNWEEGKVEYFEAPMNPEYPDGPKRRIPFTKEMYIESEDFMEEAPKRYHRLKPNGEVRLKYSYIVKCVDYIKNEAGEVVEIHCTYDPTSKPGAGPWRSVKGTIHWVSVPHSENITVNLFDKLFTEEQMGSIPEGKDYREYLNPDSLVVKEAFAEPDLLKDESGIAVQFERIGYFKKDPKNGGYNKATGLRDSFKL
jgi:glutaminyl-tRNA synthetase